MPRSMSACKQEVDPYGMDPHAPGAKLDAGKPRPALVLGAFSRALGAVVDVGTYGARKYTDHGWITVQDGERRYMDAAWRHLLADARGEHVDPDTDIAHLAHCAWNLLAVLELRARGRVSGAQPLPPACPEGPKMPPLPEIEPAAPSFALGGPPWGIVEVLRA